MGNRLVASVILVCCLVLTPSETNAAPGWALDPAATGPVLPPAGRSLFDLITAEGVPFPFDALVRRIEQRIGCAPGACTTAVLIPLGRSLQRAAAAPEFFAFPRVVLAVTGEGHGPFVAKDRLYLGYQERADLLEVISYNQEAGRFEFQIVRNYRAGSAPELVYATRAVCLACHQNQAPIFSRQIWDETNANPEVAARLARSKERSSAPVRTQIHGVSIARGVDIPNALDDSTDRANLIGVTQRLWRDACSSTCRVQALTAALQYRLSGERAFEAMPNLATGFSARWPAGLAVPNPDIPNRDPLAFAKGATGVEQVDIPARLEPIAPRAPIDVWKADDPALTGKFIAGLAALIAADDVDELERALALGTASAKRRTLRATCHVSGQRVECTGSFTLRGSASLIDELEIDAKRLPRLEWKKGKVTRDGRVARTAAGDAIERLTLERIGNETVATLTVGDDFAPARMAIAKAAWPDAPFSRAAMRAALGLKSRAGDGAAALAPPRADELDGKSPAQAGNSEVDAFFAPCAACHRTPERSPPNFLTGDARQVSAKLAQCAPRIFVRLAMWQVPAATRGKVPMPPPRTSHDGNAWIQSEPDPAIAALQARVAGWLRAESGSEPVAAAMLARGYENLRPCLPAGT
jgi:hypothetical protein